MASYTAQNDFPLTVHAVGIDEISMMVLSLLLAPRHHTLLWEDSPLKYLGMREAFRCDLLFIDIDTLHREDADLAGVYCATHEHSRITRVAVLMPDDSDDTLCDGGMHWDAVLRLPFRVAALRRVVEAAVSVTPGHGGEVAAQGTAAGGGADGANPQAETQADLEGLRQLAEETGLDDAMVRELCDSFTRRGREYIDTLSKALAGDDAIAELQPTCHAMKGMVGNMRFQHLRATAERLEHACMLNDRSEALAALDAFKVSFESIAQRVCPT